LNPSCIRFLSNKLSNITTRPNEGQRRKYWNLIDGKINTKGNKVSPNELIELKEDIFLAKYLKIEPSNDDDLEPGVEVNLSIFNAEILEIVKSNVLSINLDTMSNNIITLNVRRSLTMISDILGNNDEENWKSLENLICSYNSLTFMDQSLLKLKNVKYIDFSNNKISSIDNLQNCAFLETLNLEFNNISSVEHAYLYMGNVTHLILKNNKLSSLNGIEKLKGIEKLDLRENQISLLEEISRLNMKNLPCLFMIYLLGNPISLRDDYRKEIYTLIFNESLILDGREAVPQEIENIKKTKAVDPIIVAPTTIKTSKKSSKKKKIKIKNLDQQDQQINIPKSYSNNEIEIESFKEDLIKNYQQYKEDGRWLHIVESKISNSLSPSLIRKIESPSSEIDKKENSSEEKELNVTEESISPKSAPEKISIESKINDEKNHR